MKRWMLQFMQGRYGGDKLNQVLIIVGAIVLLFSAIFQFVPGTFLSMVIILITYYRVFSKNYTARYKENQKFLTYCSKIEKGFRIRISQIKDIKAYKYFKCPKCRQSIRVPRKKGNIEINCSKCHEKFNGKT